MHRGTAPDSITGVPHYAPLRVKEVYPGVDVDFYKDHGNLEYDFLLRPGADPKQIRIALDGQRDLRVDSHAGDLVAVMPAGGELHHIRPKVYQQVGERWVEVAASYALVKPNIATFTLGAYDTTKALTIDPTLQVVQFMGQNATGSAMAVDNEGNAYLMGNTADGFPVTNKANPYDDGSAPSSFWIDLFNIFANFPDYFGFNAAPANFEPDRFVAKLSPAGTILYATYFGLSFPTGIAVDSTGIVVTGWRQDSPSSDIKFGNGPFAGKITLTGGDVYFSVLSSSDKDMTTGVALDSQHNAWVSGYTFLRNGATLDKPDAMALKVDPQGTLRSVKIYDGSGADQAYAVAVDKVDNVWITGQTCSPDDFPVTTHGIDLFNNPCSIFVAKLLGQENATKFVNVFGGGDKDAGLGITVDANGIAYVTGVIVNPSFPTSTGAYQRQPTGAYSQGFIMEADDAGDCLRATLIGSNGDTVLNSIALNAAREVYVGGNTTATTFPGNGPLFPHPMAGLIMKFTPDLGTLLYSRQEGIQVNGVAITEAVPTVSAAKIYTVGNEVLDPAHKSPLRAFFDVLADDLQYLRIRNYWKLDEYINIESGVPDSGSIFPGWLSAQWTLEQQAPVYGDPAATPVFWIHNVWKPDEYLNVENGGLQSTAIAPGWLSALGDGTGGGGTNLYRIRNVWKLDLYLNNQNGSLVATDVIPGWWSAMWTMERVY